MSTSGSYGATATRGMFFTGGGQVVRQVIQISTNVILARLLTPEDFGLLGMALVFVGVAQLFASFGIGSAIVQSGATDEAVLSSCFWANTALAGALALVLVAAAPYIASLYETPRVATAVMILSSTVLIGAMQGVPGALLMRDLRFADLVVIQMCSGLAGAIVAVTMAFAGFGVWSLVAQPVVGVAWGLGHSAIATRWLPRLCFSYEPIRELVSFSLNVLGANLLNYANRQSDKFLLGKFAGSTALGHYTLAYQLMLYPMQQVSQVVVRVLFPTLAQFKEDHERLGRAYLRATASIAVVTFPMMAGLFAVADDFIVVVFGEQWVPMLPVLEVLCWVGLFQSVGATVGTLYLSTGRTRTLFRTSMCLTPVMIIGFVLGLPWGAVGVATAYAITSFVSMNVTHYVAYKIVGLPIAALYRAVWRPMLAAVVMLLAVTASREVLFESPFARLVVSVGVGVLAYILASALVNRRQLADLTSQMRDALSKH